MINLIIINIKHFSEPLTMSTRIQQEIFSTPFSVYPAKKVTLIHSKKNLY